MNTSLRICNVKSVSAFCGNDGLTAVVTTAFFMHRSVRQITVKDVQVVWTDRLIFLLHAIMRLRKGEMRMSVPIAYR